jgi:hypothetical protein
VPADPMFLYINDIPDTLCYELWADSHFVRPADMAALLRRMEAVLVDAVLADTIPPDAVPPDTASPGTVPPDSVAPAMDAVR